MRSELCSKKRNSSKNRGNFFCLLVSKTLMGQNTEKHIYFIRRTSIVGPFPSQRNYLLLKKLTIENKDNSKIVRTTSSE